MTRRRILVCYDITNDRVRTRVADELGWWGSRVQKSVFLIHASHSDLKALRRELRGWLTVRTDTILFVELCGQCVPRMQEVGMKRAAAIAKRRPVSWVVI